MMGKRKGQRKAAKEAPIPGAEQEIREVDEEGQGSGFFACYLLTSLCPRFKGHTYIGYTLNPRRRIRQHNGEIGSGAWRTKRKRPWEMVLCVYGFPTNIAALQFEWAWQHPVESLAVRKAAASFKSLSGLANKIKLVYTMLTLPPWQSLNLTVNLFSTKYRHYTTACPALPEQMRTRVCSMEELPCYDENACVNDEWDDIEGEGSSQEFKDNESIAAVREEVHNSPCYDFVPEEDFNQQINHIVGTCLESSGCSVQFPSPVREDKQRRFCINDYSPPRTSSPSTSSYVAEETGSPRLMGLTAEPLNKQTTTMVANEHQPSIKNSDISIREVEIIDIFTPSPSLEKFGNKKRRPNLWPEVIDLTNSPIYV